ncbi:cytochrome c oxidase cbb3-type subunit 4 [Stella humosa]|uniref:Cytochrome c oxidase cbb3-type subunit 4 n=1 Tax=Stella humosa TaxID=94 RepID=A0A3N1KLX0_9PROT|nr:cbb3-type cytochrome c oxidase subunit 3 [Stella humosa]ROP81344.1 cytochrome c oxidase cbb3-type subunit 4 [Stella humosa]BBK32694.1 hypothetical protein STHU_33280 [Stella humosa]
MEIMEIYAALRSLWLVWFMALFLGILVWALWPANRARLEDHGRIPFRDDR